MIISLLRKTIFCTSEILNFSATQYPSRILSERKKKNSVLQVFLDIPTIALFLYYVIVQFIVFFIVLVLKF